MSTYRMNKPIKLSSTIILMGVISWVMVHVVAFLGMFIAVGYLIWVAFDQTKDRFPQKLLFMRHPAAPIPPEPKATSLADIWYRKIPISWAVMTNFVFILLCTGLSWGVVGLEYSFLNRVTYQPPEKTASFIIPDKGKHKVGEEFTMPITLSAVDQPVNIIQADLSFDPEQVEALRVDVDGSFATIFVQKDIDNKNGFVRLTGGLPNPGYMGSGGVFGTITFRAKTVGTTQIHYLPSSIVLANDGKGSNVLVGLSSASYIIFPDTESPATPATTSKAVLYNRGEVTPSPGNRLDFSGATPLPTDTPEPVSYAATPAPNPAPAASSFSLHPLRLLRTLDGGILGFWYRFTGRK